MFKSSILTLLITLVFSLPCAAQDAEVLRWIHLLTSEQAEMNIKSAKSLPGDTQEMNRLQQKFILVQELIGGGHIMDKGAVEEKLFKIAQRLQPEMLPKDKELLKKAQRANYNLAKLVDFVKEIRPIVHEALLGQYAQKKSRVMRKAIKRGLIELPGEGTRFAAAIVINRIINCFGTNVATQFEWKTSYKDPACIHEIWETLKSPVFYAGFAAFILASRITQAKLSALLKLDEALGAKGLYSLSTSLKAQLVSNLALTAGFFADHVVQTILNNEDLHKCVKAGDILLPAIGTGSNAEKAGGHYLGDNEKGEKIYALEVLIKNPHCRKFYNHLSSKEFLAEHTFLVPLPSLLLTAATLGVATSSTVRLIKGKPQPVAQATKASHFLKANKLKQSKILKLYKAGKAVKNFAVGTIFIPGLGLVPGFILGTTRLVAFFQLNELIEPIIKNGYYNTFVKVWNNSRHQQLRDSQDDFLSKWYESSSLKNLPTKAASSQPQGPSPLLLDTKECSDHYSGKSNDSFELCSRVPLLVDMSTFRDYSTTWRQKKILGHFLELQARWKSKMDDSVYHYKHTLYQMRIMSISREMKYSSNGRVDYYDRFFNQLEESIAKAAKEASAGYGANYDARKEMTKIYERYARLEEQQLEKRNEFLSKISYAAQLVYGNKTTPVEIPFKKKRAKILKSLGEKEARLFQLLEAQVFLQYEFDELTNGDIYHNVTESEDEVQEIKQAALDFLDGPVDFKTINQALIGRSWKVHKTLEKLGLLESYQRKSGKKSQLISIKKILVEMIKNEDEDISGQGLYLLKNLLKSSTHPLAASSKKGRISNHSPELTEKQLELRSQLIDKLQLMDPTYKHEHLYALLLRKGLQEDSSETVRWTTNKSHFSTKHIADYTMSQLFCDQMSTSADWFGNEGTPHVFQHPQLGEGTNYCRNYIALVERNSKERYQSVNKSIFVSEQGVYQGLFQLYLNLPEGQGIWDTEKKTRQWWIKKFEPLAMTQIIDFEEKYKRIVKEDFLPKIGNLHRAREILGVNQGNFILNLLKSKSFFGLGTESLEYSAGEDLAESLSAELKEYRKIIYGVGRPLAPNRHWLEKKNMDFSSCFVQLLGSLQSKNYKPLKKQCEKSLDELKNKLVYSNGYTQRTMLTLSGKKEEKLSEEEIAKLIVWRALKMIDKLIFELDGYKKIATGELNLNLKKMTNRDCFEHNLENLELKDMMMEKENENTDSCFVPAANN